MNFLTTSTTNRLMVGDFYDINNPRMAATGRIVKVNRVTIVWEGSFFGRPVNGRIARHEFVGCRLIRDGQPFTFQP